MKILAIIPARGGSKGVPRKNIKLLGKMPLIEYTINAAKASIGLAEIVVSTEDVEIAIAAEVCGCKPPFVRPAELSEDDASSISVVQHAIASRILLGIWCHSASAMLGGNLDGLFGMCWGNTPMGGKGQVVNRFCGIGAYHARVGVKLRDCPDSSNMDMAVGL